MSTHSLSLPPYNPPPLLPSLTSTPRKIFIAAHHAHDMTPAHQIRMQRHPQLQVQVSDGARCPPHTPHLAFTSSQFISHFKPNLPHSSKAPAELVQVPPIACALSHHYALCCLQCFTSCKQYACRRLSIHALLASAGAFGSARSRMDVSCLPHTYAGLQDMFLLPPPTSHAAAQVNFEFQVPPRSD
jgi:hypothetical protein